MDVPFLLSRSQMRRIEPFFPLSHGIPRVDDRRIVSGIVYVIKHGLMWRDAPTGYGPHKTIYNRFIRWSRLGVFNRIRGTATSRSGLTAQALPSAAAPARVGRYGHGGQIGRHSTATGFR